MIPGMPETIPALFFSQVRRYGPSPACWVKRDGRYQAISWAAFADEVQALGLALMELGIRPGDRVAILSENRPEWAVADLAILAVGAISVPIYTTLAAREIEQLLLDARAVAIIVSTEAHAATVEQIRDHVPTLQHIIQIEARPLGLFPRGVQWYGELVGLGRSNRAAAPTFFGRVHAVRPSDVASLVYTSGTTGLPKGVMLTHDNFLSNCRACAQVIPVTEFDRTLSFLPLSHVFERMAGYYFILFVGGAIAYAESMDRVPANLAEVHPTVVCAVPRFYEKLYARVMEAVQAGSPLKRALVAWAVAVGRRVAQAHETRRPLGPGLRLQQALADRLVFHKLRARLGGRLRFFISGGAPLAKELAEFFYGAGLLILEGYGLTETSPVITCNTPTACRFGTVGRPIPGVEVRIAEDGEILTRGPHIMRGYFNNPTATREVLDPDGWFHTGDVGTLDAEGFLTITDRKKELIVTAGGKKVAPAAIEQLLKSDPAIADAVVLGDRRPYLTALVVPAPGALRRCAESLGLATLSTEALVRDPSIVAWYRERCDGLQHDLASFERIKRFTLLDHPFSQEAGELTPTLKVKRRVVAQRYAPLIEAMYRGT